MCISSTLISDCVHAAIVSLYHRNERFHMTIYGLNDHDHNGRAVSAFSQWLTDSHIKNGHIGTKNGHRDEKTVILNTHNVYGKKYKRKKVGVKEEL